MPLGTIQEVPETAMAPEGLLKGRCFEPDSADVDVQDNSGKNDIAIDLLAFAVVESNAPVDPHEERNGACYNSDGERELQELAMHQDELATFEGEILKASNRLMLSKPVADRDASSQAVNPKSAIAGKDGAHIR